MKKIVLTVSAIICAVCTGCLKQEKSGYEENNVKGALTINVEGAVQNTSKASGTASQSDEDRVGSVQIFLFSEDGKIEVQAYSGNSRTIHRSLPRNIYKIDSLYPDRGAAICVQCHTVADFLHDNLANQPLHLHIHTLLRSIHIHCLSLVHHK